MKNSGKKFVSVLLAFCMSIALLPTFAGAEGTLTRSEWVSQLVETFSMTVENDDNMPDNYFSDITSDMPYYRDILLAVEFGVINIEAGQNFYPDEAATREFAAQTINACLAFQLDENTEYTYSEYDSVTYPDDIQIAINQGWFALSDGNFLPEQPITTEESEAIFDSAKKIIDSEKIDENYNSTYEFAEGVIVIPENYDVTIDSDYTVTISDCETEITKDDIFVVYSNGFPVALKALNVDTVENNVVISATKDGAEGAILSADSQGSIALDLSTIEFDEVSTYSIQRHSKLNSQDEELTVRLYNVDYDEESDKITATKTLDIDGTNIGSISIEVENLYMDRSENTTDGTYSMTVNADITVTANVSIDPQEQFDLPSSITIGSLPIAGVGSVKLEAECNINGSMSLSSRTSMEVGFEYNREWFIPYRLIKNFEKPEFFFTAEAKMEVGAKVSVEAGLVFVKANIWGSVGAAIKYTRIEYQQGLPSTCETSQGYMYAKVGAGFSINYVLDKIEKNIDKDIFTDENSPIRKAYHYEDSKWVPECTRGNIPYLTKPNSKNFFPFSRYAQGSYTSADGTPIVLWEYTVENGDATVTAYKGFSNAVIIPSTIDGYTVTKIGSNVFYNTSDIKSVIIPDSVTDIDYSAFERCQKLTYIKIGKGVKSIAPYVFRFCYNLTDIYVDENNPKYSASNGILFNKDKTELIACPSAKDDYIIPNGVKQIGYCAFEWCAMTSVVIPDSVTDIHQEAFKQCELLANVRIGNGVKNIYSGAFNDCRRLKNIFIPQNVEDIDESAFIYSGISEISVSEDNPYYSDVDGVLFNKDKTKIVIYPSQKIQTEYIIPDGVTSIGRQAFYNCYNLANIVISDNITSISEEAFEGTELYNNAKNWENGVLYIGNHLIKANGDVLGEYTIKNGTSTIADSAFRSCSSLTGVIVPESMKHIGKNAFEYCLNLSDVTIPDCMVDIDIHAFYNTEVYNNADNWENGIFYIGNHLIKADRNISNCEIKSTTCNITNSAFEGCYDLTYVYYDGTKEQWENINLFFSGNSSLTNAKIHCLDGVCDFGYCLDDGDITITQYYGESSKAEIPALIKGFPVTEIAFEAFRDCDLTDITIPDSIKNINDFAFYGCENLKNIILPNSVVRIGEKAFGNCFALNSINIPDSVTNIEQGAFAQCSSLTNINVSANNKNYTISNNALMNKEKTEFIICLDKGAQSYNIPNGIVKIGESAFYDCRNLSDIIIPNTVMNISSSAFINTARWSYSSNWEDGVLYIGDCLIDVDTHRTIQPITQPVIKDGTRLIADYAFSNCDEITSLVIPNSVTSIGAGAFQSCGIESITIPNKVTNIEQETFSDCYNLQSVFIPNSVTDIDAGAFESSNLTDIYYGGTKEQWNSIEIKNIDSYGAEWLNATIHYNSSGLPLISIGEINISKNDNILTIPLEDVVSGCQLIAAFYNGNTLISSKTENISAGDTSKTVEIPDNADNVKVFIWDSLKGMRPLCEAKTKTIE